MEDEQVHEEVKIIGKRVKEFRLRRRQSLQELGRKTDTSAGYLSRVERGISIPSLGLLSRLSQIFGCPLSAFTHQGTYHDRCLYRKSRRPSVVSKDGGRKLEFLTDVLDGNPLMEVALLSLEPGSRFADKHTHSGEEVIYVLEGKLRVELDEEKYVLNPQDSICFESKIPHTVGNPGESSSKALVALSPPNPRLPEK